MFTSWCQSYKTQNTVNELVNLFKRKKGHNLTLEDSSPWEKFKYIMAVIIIETKLTQPYLTILASLPYPSRGNLNPPLT